MKKLQQVPHDVTRITGLLYHREPEYVVYSQNVPTWEEIEKHLREVGVDEPNLNEKIKR